LPNIASASAPTLREWEDDIAKPILMNYKPFIIPVSVAASKQLNITGTHDVHDEHPKSAVVRA
jgi:hypothetical protein